MTHLEKVGKVGNDDFTSQWGARHDGGERHTLCRACGATSAGCIDRPGSRTGQYFFTRLQVYGYVSHVPPTSEPYHWCLLPSGYCCDYVHRVRQDSGKGEEGGAGVQGGVTEADGALLHNP